MPESNAIDTASTDVIIVGSGPTGLMAGLLLTHCGIRVRILDKSTQQAHESRAFALQARSLELLLNLGIVDQFMQRGVIVPGMQVYRNGKQAVSVNITDIGETDSPFSFLFMLPQSEIENLLVATLAERGVPVEHQMEVMHFTQDSDGIAVAAQNPQGETVQLHASYLIGADGAHSVIREGLGLTFAGEAYPQTFMLADCAIDWPLEYAYGKIFFRGKALGLYLPMRGKELGRIIAMDLTEKRHDQTTATTAEPLDLGTIETAIQAASGLPVKLSKPQWVTRYRIHHRGVNHYGEGRVFVAGDAAHIHSPVGGQGMNTGLQDAANLAWKLALSIKHFANHTLLDTYNAERWPVGQKLLRFTDRFFSRLTSRAPLATTLRNWLVPCFLKIITRVPRCRRRAFRFISELGIRYHENAFLREDIAANNHDFPKQTQPGCRAPNALYQRNKDIFGLIQGYQFHVLALSRQGLSPEDITTTAAELGRLPKSLGLPLNVHFIAHSLCGENPAILRAETNQVFERYGLTDRQPTGLFLIRPDGYIAYRSDSLDVSRLLKFCSLFTN